jgi:hypothetical protein
MVIGDGGRKPAVGAWSNHQGVRYESNDDEALKCSVLALLGRAGPHTLLALRLVWATPCCWWSHWRCRYDTKRTGGGRGSTGSPSARLGGCMRAASWRPSSAAPSPPRVCPAMLCVPSLTIEGLASLVRSLHCLTAQASEVHWAGSGQERRAVRDFVEGQYSV